MSSAEPERPILITDEHLDRRVDFERGMPVFPRVSVFLILAQAVVFSFELARGALDSTAAIVSMGAQESGALWSGEYWRLWSATMLHGSIDHFLGNAVALYITGMACEHAFGRLQFAFLYFGAALAGAMLSVTGLEPGMPAVGASGAIFGLMGAIVAMMARHRARLFVRDKRIGWVVLFWAAWTVLLGFMTPYVDNHAHIGGFAGGVLIGWFLRPAVLEAGRPSALVDRILFAVALAGVVGMTVPWICQMAASAGPLVSALPPIFSVYGL